MPFSAIGGRRFLMTIGCGIVTSALCYLGKIDGGTYATVILGTVAAFITGSTAQKFKATGGDQ